MHQQDSLNIFTAKKKPSFLKLEFRWFKNCF